MRAHASFRLRDWMSSFAKPGAPVKAPLPRGVGAVPPGAFRAIEGLVGGPDHVLGRGGVPVRPGDADADRDGEAPAPRDPPRPPRLRRRTGATAHRELRGLDRPPDPVAVRERLRD